MTILAQLGTLTLHHHCEPLLARDKKAAPRSVHHAIVIDCSYSMVSELPRLVSQLQNKLPSLVSPGDYVTVVWFSGRGQAGRILDCEPIQGLQDISRLQGLLSKWLQPVGMTGFLDPAKLVLESFQRFSVSTNAVKNLVFMSDGCENQSARSEVLSVFEALGQEVDSATVVEYGYYADRPLLTKLAEAAGGSVVLAKDFTTYDVVFETALRGGHRAVVPTTTLEVSALDGAVFSIHPAQRTLRVFSTDAGGITTVPVGTDIFWLTREKKAAPSKKGVVLKGLDAEGLSAALAVFAHRMNGPIVNEILSHVSASDLGDLFSRCFGKQRYQDFIDRAVAAGVDGTVFEVKPSSIDRKRSTLLDLLHGIEASEEKVFLRLDAFLPSYERISRSREDATGLGVQFQRTSDDAEIMSLTWNEERPNISILTKQYGDAVVPADLVPRDLRSRFHVRDGDREVRIATHVFRNYAVVKDGIIHGETLPLLSDGGKKKNIDLTKLAVLNWKDVERVSATEFFRNEYRLFGARSLQKVLRALLKEKAPEALAEARSAAIAKVYGDEAAQFLRTIGVTDNGYAPTKTASAAASDVYLGKALKVSMKGYSDVPSIKEVREMVKKGKVAPRGAFMADYLKIYENASVDKIEASLKVAIQSTRDLILVQAKARFAVLVGQVWFHEFSSLDENSLTVDGIEYKVEMKDVEIAI